MQYIEKIISCIKENDFEKHFDFYLEWLNKNLIKYKYLKNKMKRDKIFKYQMKFLKIFKFKIRKY